MKLFITWVLASTIALMGTTEASANRDVVCGDQGPKIIMLPGGGFQSAAPEVSRGDCEYLGARGFRVRVLGYPVGGYYYDAIAKLVPRDAYVVGFSAGGTYALHLAARRRIRGAVAISPLVPDGWQFTFDALHNLLGWGQPGSEYPDLPPVPDFKPGPHGSSPTVVFQDPRDMLVDYQATLRYCQRYRGVRMVTSYTTGSGYHPQPSEAWMPFVIKRAR